MSRNQPKIERKLYLMAQTEIFDLRLKILNASLTEFCLGRELSRVISKAKLIVDY